MRGYEMKTIDLTKYAGLSGPQIEQELLKLNGGIEMFEKLTAVEHTTGDIVDAYWVIREGSPQPRVAILVAGTDTQQSQKEYAQLFAAAPDLFQAAKCAEADLYGFVCDHLDDDPETSEHPAAQSWRDLKAAIAKAEGK
jgi:hypothetical protein